MINKKIALAAACFFMFNIPDSLLAEPAGDPPDDTSVVERLDELESTVVDLLEGMADQQRVIDVLVKQNQDLIERLTCVASTSGTQDFIFDGCNVHVRNGAGSTNSINGRGNLIIGYDAARANESDKTGSHNLVIGDNHNYTQYGGFVAGFENTIAGAWASVSGGAENTASDHYASVSAGQGNTANQRYASVSGGWANFASALHASVSGGVANRAFGPASSVSGGENNEARALSSSILGSAGQITTIGGQTIPATP